MSRAFVKENDGDDFSENLPERPVSDKPNYVTRRGLRLIDETIAALRQGLAEAQAAKERGLIARHMRELRYWATRRGTAREIAPGSEPQTVAFGSKIVFEHEDGRRQQLRIVGEDEADPVEGRVSWCAPIAQTLAGNQTGDMVLLPNGEVEIVTVDQTPEA